MSKSNVQRQRVEPGIWQRAGADGREIFEITFRDSDGIQRRRRVPGGITAARKALRDQVGKRDRGERVQADPRLTFSQAADAWWEMRATNLRPATQSAYSAALKHLRPAFGRQRLAGITPADVANYITARQAEPVPSRSTKAPARTTKGWTIRGELTVLSAVFKHATRHMGFNGSSPVAALDRIERPSIEDEKPKRVLTRDELGRLVAAVPEQYRLVFELAAETGARLSEALGLVWSEIDLTDGAVHFTHQLDRQGRRVPLKTKRSNRRVEITEGLAGKLTAAKLAARNSGDHAYVFVSRTGAPHDHRNIGGRVLAAAVKRAALQAVERDGKVVLPAPTFHHLRHTHGSQLIAAGWDIEEVSARLGHANVATTARIYVHEYDAAQRSKSRRDRLAAMYADPAPDTGGEVVALPS